MKAAVLSAMLVIAAAATLVPQPAAAGYVPPDAPWTTQVFCIRGC